MVYLSVCLISFFVLLILRIIRFLIGCKFLILEKVYFYEFELLDLNSTRIRITFLFDWISLFFISFVFLISSLVIFYSYEYISSDKTLNRFILLVLLFVGSIFFLIIRPNLIRILLGWDGLGLVSYCLVIYFQNIKSYNAGILTAMSNRIGDVFILITIAWILNFGSWRYIFFIDLLKIDFEIQVISIIIVIAAITKRAQIPFSAWLPAAIAAPTPVSALVHSSTLVTAGVYLLIRFNNLIIRRIISQILLILGCLTIFIAGVGANYEFDLKKIIALSTLRQLGLIIRILSIGFPIIAFFHLLTHALFKALLFICAGVVIHSIKNFQDIRYMGGLINQLPITIIFFNLSNLALCGAPFLAGFYSKDIILEIVTVREFNFFIYFVYFFSTGLTVCYSLRLIGYTIFSNYRRWVYHCLFDESKIITFGMRGLIVMSIIGGAVLRWIIFPTPICLFIPIYIKLITLIVCLIGGISGVIFFNWRIYIHVGIINDLKSHYFGSIWFLPYLSTIGVNYFPLHFATNYLKIVDNGWSEEIGGQNIYTNIVVVRKFIQILHNNNLKIFLVTFFIWAFLIFFILVCLNSL